MPKIEAEDVAERIRVALLPDLAFVEVWEYRNRIRLQVRAAEDNAVLFTVPDLLVHEADEEASLAAWMRIFQAHVAEKKAAKKGEA